MPKPLQGVVLAVQADEAVGQDAAGEKFAKLALNDRRQPATFLARRGSAEKGLEMLLNDAIEHGVLCVARAIHLLGGRHAQQYRRGLPMPKDGYAGSIRAPARRSCLWVSPSCV